MTRPVNGHSNSLRNMASAESRGHNRKAEEHRGESSQWSLLTRFTASTGRRGPLESCGSAPPDKFEYSVIVFEGSDKKIGCQTIRSTSVGILSLAKLLICYSALDRKSKIGTP